MRVPKRRCAAPSRVAEVPVGAPPRLSISATTIPQEERRPGPAGGTACDTHEGRVRRGPLVSTVESRKRIRLRDCAAGRAGASYGVAPAGPNQLVKRSSANESVVATLCSTRPATRRCGSLTSSDRRSASPSPERCRLGSPPTTRTASSVGRTSRACVEWSHNVVVAFSCHPVRRPDPPGDKRDSDGDCGTGEDIARVVGPAAHHGPLGGEGRRIEGNDQPGDLLGSPEGEGQLAGAVAGGE